MQGTNDKDRSKQVIATNETITSSIVPSHITPRVWIIYSLDYLT